MKCQACGYIKHEGPRKWDDPPDFVSFGTDILVYRHQQMLERPIEATVFACPKCGTLAIHEWWIMPDEREAAKDDPSPNKGGE